jgi:ATP-dependent RNA helicase DHX37/DHR1
MINELDNVVNFLVSFNVIKIAKRIDESEIKEGEDKLKYRHAYMTPEMEDPVFLHDSCVLRSERPEWVAYQEIFETKKLYMRGVTVVDPAWLATFCEGQCLFSPPLADPEPYYDQERVIIQVSLDPSQSFNNFF